MDAPYQAGSRPTPRCEYAAQRLAALDIPILLLHERQDMTSPAFLAEPTSAPGPADSPVPHQRRQRSVSARPQQLGCQLARRSGGSNDAKQGSDDRHGRRQPSSVNDDRHAWLYHSRVTADDLDVFEQLDASTLPPRQRRILVAIREWVVRYGYSPSTRQIGRAVGLRSSSSVLKHLASLEERGFLRRSTEISRPIDVRLFLRRPSSQEPVDDSVSVPVVGHIAAGSPISADEYFDGMLTLSRELTGRGTVFGLRVRGDSMIDAAICDGDIVVVRQQPEAYSGQIVAAMIDGEATVKVYRRRSGHIFLEPRNPNYDVIDGAEAVVLGVVVSVLRNI